MIKLLVLAQIFIVKTFPIMVQEYISEEIPYTSVPLCQPNQLFTTYFSSLLSIKQYRTLYDMKIDKQNETLKLCKNQINSLDLITLQRLISSNYHIHLLFNDEQYKEQIGKMEDEQIFIKVHHHFIFYQKDNEFVFMKIHEEDEHFIELQNQKEIEHTYSFEIKAESEMESFLDHIRLGYLLINKYQLREVIIELDEFIPKYSLFLFGQILKQNLGDLQKENDTFENSNTLINYELFLSYNDLIKTIIIIANGSQLLYFLLLFFALNTFFPFSIYSPSFTSTLFFLYLFCSLFNGASIWWTLISIKRTSYRKSKLVWLGSVTIFLIPLYVFVLQKSIYSLIIFFIMLIVQFLGIFFGMAIRAAQLQDAYQGEYKQIFHDESIQSGKLWSFLRCKWEWKYIWNIAFQGLLPFYYCKDFNNEILEFINEQRERINLNYFWILIQLIIVEHVGVILVTYFDERNLKTSWNKQCMSIAIMPILINALAQIVYLWRQNLNISGIRFVMECAGYNLGLFLIYGGITLVSAIKLQQFLYKQRKPA